MDFDIVLVFILVAISLFGLLHLKFFSKSQGRRDEYRKNIKDDWVSPEEFERWKNKMKKNCEPDIFESFFYFLRSYGGGYVRRDHGRIIKHEYLGKEKGDLKGIFYNIIVHNRKIKTERKEEFRRYLIQIGVKGLEQKPEYRFQDRELLNDGQTEEEIARKEVGNIGENHVRNFLKQLNPSEYTVMNGAVIRGSKITKEFDHIVVGHGYIFIIETKAFGMSDGLATACRLIVDEKDQWKLLHENSKNPRELESPTKQIEAETQLIKEIIKVYPIKVQPILALSNDKIRVTKRSDLPYAILVAKDLDSYIMEKNGLMTKKQMEDVLDIISANRLK